MKMDGKQARMLAKLEKEHRRQASKDGVSRIPTQEDLLFELRVNEFISQAVRTADRQVPGLETELDVMMDESRAAQWNRVYHREMKRLTEDAGIRRFASSGPNH